ncbi:unnamed protein product [Leptosia nina]|uniref:Uncharacterized protein n=1 Tax=Leptosia nina TaxID=320188 RepID=A0AAV1K3G9_9NEOP
MGEIPRQRLCGRDLLREVPGVRARRSLLQGHRGRVWQMRRRGPQQRLCRLSAPVRDLQARRKGGGEPQDCVGTVPSEAGSGEAVLRKNQLWRVGPPPHEEDSTAAWDS